MSHPALEVFAELFLGLLADAFSVAMHDGMARSAEPFHVKNVIFVVSPRVMSDDVPLRFVRLASLAS
jgi:hypothetical protein